MSKNRKAFDNEFKNSAVKYTNEHEELTREQALPILALDKAHFPDGSRKPENRMMARSTRLAAVISNQTKKGKLLA